jgi:RNA polymerase sigma factor (sigma-70 family)
MRRPETIAMPPATLGEVLGFLRTTCAAGRDRDLPDGELLERFARQREEAAFSLLVQRHGPLVLGVCRRLLGDSHAAEDCFQATFLVLARRAATLKGCLALGGWLYGVARRIAMRARAQAAARRERERRAATMPRADVPDDLTCQELRSVLDEEIGRLPEKYATPLVLCCLQQHSYEQAARALGCTKSAVARRVARARRLLQRQLRQRGITLAAAALATAVAERPAAAAPPALLVIRTVRAALGGGTSPQALALTEDVLRALPPAPGKLVALLLAVGVAVAGLSAFGGPAESLPETTPPPAQAATPAQAAAAPVDFFGDPLPPGAVARLGSVRFRHGYNTFKVAFGPGGKVVASAGVGPGLCLWDAATGKPLLRVPLPPLAHSLALAPDGKRLVLGGSVARLIDTSTGKELRRLEPSRKMLDLDAVAFSPDGKTVAAGETRGARAFGDQGADVIVWDAAAGKVLHRLGGHKDVTAVAFAPNDGATLASADGDGKVRLWDVAAGMLLRTLQAPAEALAFDPAGKTLATAGGGCVRLWDVGSGKELRQLKADGEDLYDVAFSPDGTVLAAAGRAGKIRLWDAATGKALRSWDAPAAFGSCLAFAPDGKTLATAGGSCIRLWDPNSGEEMHPATGHTGCLRSVQFAADGKTLLSTAMDGKLLAWDLATGRDRALPLAKVTGAAAPSADGTLLAQQVYGDAFVRVWDTATGKETAALKVGAGHNASPRFSPDATRLATSSADGVRVWDLATGKELQHVQEKQFSPSAVAFSPDGKLLAFGADDKTLRLLDAATGKEVRRWQRPEDFVRDLVFSPDGGSLVSYGNPGSDLSVWDVATGKLLTRFEGLQRVVALAFAPGGRTLVAADLTRDRFPGPDETAACKLHVLEVSSGQVVRHLAMPQDSVWCVAFAPDGHTLATGGGDSTILLWDLSARAAAGKAKQLTAAELDRLWADLAGDAATADTAIGRFSLAPPQSVPFLRDRLQPKAAPAEKLAKLLGELDSKEFVVRDQAQRTLIELGESAEAAVRKALADGPALEVRMRLEQVLARLDGPELWRRLRAVEALEQAGTAEAARALEALAKTTPNPRVAFAARGAAERIGKRAVR